MIIFLLVRILRFLFGVLFQLVANQGVEESDHEVEDHSCDTPLPNCLDKGFFLSVKLFLRLEEGLSLRLDLVTD